jgi:hypothetical protein
MSINFANIVKKKESGKDRLTAKDMASVARVDESIINKAMKAGFINEPHYISKYAVDGVELSTEDKSRVDKHVESIKARRGPGFTSEENMRNVATAKVIEDARMEGKPVFFKQKEKSAEEVFAEFWKSPYGEARIAKGKGKVEIENIIRGGEWYDRPMNLTTMPDNYDQILWETRKVEAAKLQVQAELGDKEAIEKYNKIRNSLVDPTKLPMLDINKISAKDKILRD